MNVLLIGGSVILIVVLLLVFFFRRMLKRTEKAIASVTTPGDTTDRMDAEHVIVTFRTKGGKVITFEYYYNKKVFSDPYAFARLYPTVQLKYDPRDPSNYILFEKGVGDYSELIISVIVAVLMGSLGVSTLKDVLTTMDQIIVFLKWAAISGVVFYLILKFSPYFSFLNVLSKRDEDE